MSSLIRILGLIGMWGRVGERGHRRVISYFIHFPIIKPNSKWNKDIQLMDWAKISPSTSIKPRRQNIYSILDYIGLKPKEMSPWLAVTHKSIWTLHRHIQTRIIHLGFCSPTHSNLLWTISDLHSRKGNLFTLTNCIYCIFSEI